MTCQRCDGCRWVCEIISIGHGKARAIAGAPARPARLATCPTTKMPRACRRDSAPTTRAGATEPQDSLTTPC